jgi:hypothetical protein
MTTANVGWDLSFLAEEDFSTCGQYCFVKTASTTGKNTGQYITLANATGGSIIGVLQNNPKPGEEATVRVAGVSKVRVDAMTSGSYFTYGCFVVSGSGGRATGFNVGLNAAGSGYIAGRALETISMVIGDTHAGLFGKMLLQPFKYNNAA